MNTTAIVAAATAAAQDAEKKRRRGAGRPRKDEPRPLNPRREHIEEIDLHLGRAVRGARHLRGMSRFVLARKMGVGPQALEKWERGETRITAGKLWAISSLLDMPITFFFDGFGPDGADEERKRLITMLASVSADALDMADRISRLSKRQRDALAEQIDWLVRQREEDAAASRSEISLPPGPAGAGS